MPDFLLAPGVGSPDAIPSPSDWRGRLLALALALLFIAVRRVRGREDVEQQHSALCQHALPPACHAFSSVASDATTNEGKKDGEAWKAV